MNRHLNPLPFIFGLVVIAAAPGFDMGILAWVKTWNQQGLGLWWSNFAYWAGLGSTQIVLVIVVSLMGFALKKLWAKPLIMAGLASLAGAGLSVQLIKHLLGRPRPRMGLYPLDLQGPTFNSDFHSFPSGHMATSVALATVLSSLFPKGRNYFFGIAFLVGLGRIIGANHHLSDVLAGTILGLIVGLPLAWMIRKKD